MKQKINYRLALIALVAVMAAAVSITLVYYRLFQDQVRKDLKVQAQLLCDTELFQNLTEDPDGIEDTAGFTALAKLENDNLRITWISQSGRVLYDNDTDPGTMPNHLDRPEIRQALETGAGESVRRSDTLNMNTFYYALLLENHTILRVSTQARSIFSVFLSAAPVILIICLIIIGLCVVLGHYLTAQLLRPIEMMAEQLDNTTAVPVYKELKPFADKIRSQHENILSAATSRQDFTANISHELKTPLTAISGYAELIENRMVEGEHAVHIAEQIGHNADRLLSLINDIIKLSELDHSELPRHFSEVNLSEIAGECCRNMQVAAAQCGIRLSFRGSPAVIRGERELLKELVENLVQNAIRYNRENGYVRVSVTAEKGRAVLTVEDNGIGIPEDKQGRIFERFYRVDKSRSRETGGTGLGLAIVKHIAEIHQAEIGLTSRVGAGTTVTVTF